MDVYKELEIDLVENCAISMFTASKIVARLDQIGLLDYDALKETFLYSDEEE